MRYLLAFILLFTFVPSALAITSTEYCAEPVEVEFLQLLNQYRAQNGAGPVVMDQYLGTAAEHHTMLESSTNNLFHDYPEIGFSWSQNMRDHGWTAGGWLAEITAGSSADAAVTLNVFKNSPPHNEGMIDPKYQTVGISRYDDGGMTQARYWWVIEFSSSPIMRPATLCGTPPTETPTRTPAPTATSVPTQTATMLPPTATGTAASTATIAPTPPKKCPTRNPHYPNC